MRDALIQLTQCLDSNRRNITWSTQYFAEQPYVTTKSRHQDQMISVEIRRQGLASMQPGQSEYQSMRCPCRKKSETISYADCCLPFIDGRQVASTAEMLMRTRYTAFVLSSADYLMATWHPSTRPAQIEFNEGQEWLLLKIIDSQTDDDTAVVEFTARSRIKAPSGSRNHLLHERSRFVRENDRWFYVDGKIK